MMMEINQATTTKAACHFHRSPTSLSQRAPCGASFSSILPDRVGDHWNYGEPGAVPHVSGSFVRARVVALGDEANPMGYYRDLSLVP
jgi:hypothetical protein